ncbi:MAG: cytochrome P450 [Coxiellaceae bacterium]|nr:cytochrome P450 [Coxiellaceae bacterium]
MMNEPPRYTKNIPVLGAAKAYAKYGPLFLKKLQHELGDTFSFKLLNKWVTISFADGFVRKFYRSNEDELSFINPLTRVRLPQIIGAVASEDKWDAMMHIMQSKLMPHYNRIISDIDEAVLLNLDGLLPHDNGTIDLAEAMDHLVISISCRALCIPMAENVEFIHLIKQLEKNGTHQLKRPGMLGFAVMRKCRQVRHKIADMLQQEINRRRKLNLSYADMLQFVMETDLKQMRSVIGVPLYENYNKMPDQFIIDSVIGLFFGSIANTNSVLVNAISHILSDNKLHQALINEIQLSKENLSNDRLTKETLKCFTAIGDVVSETTRYYSTLLSFRQTQSAFHIPDTNYCIPNKRLIAISPQMLMKSNKRFTSPECFNPGKNRLCPVSAEKPAYRPNLGFGDGVHYCKGARLADIECRVILIRLLQKYALVPLTRANLDQVNWTTLGVGVLQNLPQVKYTKLC